MIAPTNSHYPMKRCPSEHHPSTGCSTEAFTLIELLVVISIIGILAGLLLPVVSKVTVNAQKVQAKSTELQIANSILSFQTDYGMYPMPADAPTNTDVCFGSDVPKVSELYDILMANPDQAAINPRAVKYIELPVAKNQTPGQSKNGLGSDGQLYDPWGTIYLIGVDGNYDNYVNNPYGKNAGSSPLQLGVIVYSWGPDKLTTSDFFGGGDKNDPTSQDDVISWQ